MTAVMAWERLGGKVTARHLDLLAVVYVRQSTWQQVIDHGESTRLQYALVERAVGLGWAASRVMVIDEDLGKSGSSAIGRVGFQRLGERDHHGACGPGGGHRDVAPGTVGHRLVPAAGAVFAVWCAAGRH
jgi:hypothetical protein